MWSNMRRNANLINNILTACPAVDFIRIMVEAFDATPLVSDVHIRNINGPSCVVFFLCVRACKHAAGSPLRIDELHQIDVSQVKDSQLIPSTDPRPTSDQINNQMMKIMKVLGMIGNRVGLSNDQIEAALASVH